MEFNEVTETFEVFKKLHTANQGKDKTIFYRDVNNMKGTMSITNFNGIKDNFKLELISHMSLNNYDGLLIQYDSLDGRKLYPYRYMNIKDIEIGNDSMVDERDELYPQFWVYLAYFFSLILFTIGYLNNYQNYIYYGFLFFIIGICMIISFKLNKILDILTEEDFTFYEDSD